ncbi:uncharacterized protein LOC111713535 [Eurytemora carolleeae]|uniref:uncharacterized protein LOC111713535 n=1 Tax=Eurytemora carolleeae TaxID=1294199 RepID=UPI000C780FC3|nr:uncharacterized protein LOC111713535 [Eurytemora carolleeae]|eukprot:XP_023344179.1 uncharacterized protein LOC111713535 [Eurytemora affinis]
MYIIYPLFRVLTSVYEAVNIQSILGCREKQKDLTPLWFLYISSVVQFLQVINASVNLPIYMFASKSFKTAAGGMFKWSMPAFPVSIPRLNHIVVSNPELSTTHLNTPIIRSLRDLKATEEEEC